MSIITATEARKNLYRLIDEVNESHEPVYISGKRCHAVLVSERDWGCTQEALYILSNQRLRESIFEGLRTPLEECGQEAQENPIRVMYTKQASQDAEELVMAGDWEQAEQVLDILRQDPYKNPPKIGKLVGDLKDVYCRRVSIYRRILYEVFHEKKIIKILRMCSLYDD